MAREDLGLSVPPDAETVSGETVSVDKFARPWAVRSEDGPPLTDILGASGRLVATVYPDHYRLLDPSTYGSAAATLRSYADAEKTTALIVAAVNAYDDFIAILTDLIAIEDSLTEAAADIDALEAVIKRRLAAVERGRALLVRLSSL